MRATQAFAGLPDEPQADLTDSRLRAGGFSSRLVDRHPGDADGAYCAKAEVGGSSMRQVQ